MTNNFSWTFSGNIQGDENELSSVICALECISVGDFAAEQNFVCFPDGHLVLQIFPSGIVEGKVDLQCRILKRIKQESGYHLFVNLL